MRGQRLVSSVRTEFSPRRRYPGNKPDGQGLVPTGIRARGETPFLHALASNTGAVRLYESMGFRLRRTITFSAVSVPAGAAASLVEEQAAGVRAD